LTGHSEVGCLAKRLVSLKGETILGAELACLGLREATDNDAEPPTRTFDDTPVCDLRMILGSFGGRRWISTVRRVVVCADDDIAIGATTRATLRAAAYRSADQVLDVQAAASDGLQARQPCADALTILEHFAGSKDVLNHGTR
jgi:hypothetical protein